MPGVQLGILEVVALVAAIFIFGGPHTLERVLP
jgi:hypothetical protein